MAMLSLKRSDEDYMREALKEAEKALLRDEVPVGAIVVLGDKIIARGHNLTETLNDVTAHAEMQCLTSAADFIGGKYLRECALYVTLEPCVMCAGALFWSQIGTVVYGATDEKRGYHLQEVKMHPKSEVISGVLAEECGAMISEFFRKKR